MEKLHIPLLVKQTCHLCSGIMGRLVVVAWESKILFAIVFIAMPSLLSLPLKAAPFFYGDNIESKLLNERTTFQDRVVKGVVANDAGEALGGVTVQLKGSNIIVTTAQDGSFSINVPDGAVTLIFSYIGMQTQEANVRDNTPVRIALKSEDNTLSDVVVVGYGTQKKVNLTGSVATVSSKTLLERPATNAANLLQGRVTGLQVIQPTASPGRDDPQFRIRGLGSFGASSNPLILVDGIIGSITNLNPNDIESVSVLKDAASAAIYGSRAANGVILVTTKRGRKGEPLLEYRIDVGSHTATRLPDFIYNSVEYMTMYNAAKARVGLPALYTQEQIDAYENPTDKAQYPNFNWSDHYFNPATVINHNLRFSGGNEKTNYSISLGYLDQDGVLPSFNYKRYNAIINLNSQVNKRIRVGTIINMVKKNITEPRSTNSDIVLLVY